jgi:hypothetical protein
MTKKLVLLACIGTLALSASAQNATIIHKGPWATAPKSHSLNTGVNVASEDAIVSKTAPKDRSVTKRFNVAEEDGISKGIFANAPKDRSVTKRFNAASETAFVSKTAPKDRSVTKRFNADSIASPADLTNKYGPSAPLGGSKGGRVGRK